MSESEWRWDGRARHFIASHLCRFGIWTWVPGRFLVSTVGHYHSANQGSDPCGEGAPLVATMLNAYYETLVFACGIDGKINDYSEKARALVYRDTPPATGEEIEAAEREAMANHMKLCRRWLA